MLVFSCPVAEIEVAIAYDGLNKVGVQIVCHGSSQVTHSSWLTRGATGIGHFRANGFPMLTATPISLKTSASVIDSLLVVN
jgi:hypothetical protein